MRKVIIAILLVIGLAAPVSAAQYTAPPVPDSGQYIFPDEPESFAEGLWSIFTDALDLIQPAIGQASLSCIGLIAIAIIISIFEAFPGNSKQLLETVSALCICALLLGPSNTLVRLGTDTVTELSEYGKMLLPVMTAAVAAQGGTGTSAALYVGTCAFDAVLCALISNLIVPMIYLYLCLSVANCAVGQELLGKLRDFIKWLMTWILKIVLYVFIGYIGVTGVVSGSADVAAVKAAKLAISGAVPVVGSILSDASEAILVSAGVMKSAAGVYGLLALLSLYIGPFIEIGVQYILLKITAAVCGVFGVKRPVELIQDFSSAMGLLLAMTGTICLLLMISTVCFMRGAG